MMRDHRRVHLAVVAHVKRVRALMKGRCRRTGLQKLAPRPFQRSARIEQVGQCTGAGTQLRNARCPLAAGVGA